MQPIYRMGKRCVVGGCSNVSNAGKKVVLHTWPLADNYAQKWDAFVSFTRGERKKDRLCPTICSDHFKVSRPVSLKCRLLSDYKQYK